MSQWINGAWSSGAGDYFAKTNPVGGELLWQGQAADAQQVAAACHAAREAFPRWAAYTFSQRQRWVENYRCQLEQHKEQWITTIAQETAKPRWEASAEVAAMINKIAISIEAYHGRTGSYVVPNADGAASLRHRPHGILAVFGPYNFPGHLPNGHIVPALLAGNTLVFKPSELTPGTAALMASCWENAGLPPGVLNVVQGPGETGRLLAEQPGIDGILFTGSAATGHQLHRQLAGQPHKILALEMGGNNALIVEDTADLDGAVYMAIQSAFISAGQRCTCARRLLVKQGPHGDAFIDRLVQVTARVCPGAWDASPPPFMGGLISQTAVEQVMHAWHHHLARGGRPLLIPQQRDPNRTLLTPGIVDISGVDHPPDEEVFGPLLTVERYVDLGQAISMANHTRYGLACGLISADRSNFERLLIEARAGIVNWNRPLTGAASNLPFGGIGASGNHRPSAWYAADYCAWPMASLESIQAHLPEIPTPGLDFRQ